MGTNPLGEEKIGALLRKFAIPSIVAMLVSSLYNIVDQFFIGQSIGELGNAATNISFPLSISCIAIALLFGIGGASSFNISLGRGQAIPEEAEKAPNYIGNSITMRHSFMLIYTAIPKPAAGIFWFAQKCTALCKNLYPDCFFRFPFPNSGNWGMPSNPCRRQAEIRNVLQSGWGCHQYHSGCPFCVCIPMGHGRCCGSYRNRADYIRHYGNLDAFSWEKYLFKESTPYST